MFPVTFFVFSFFFLNRVLLTTFVFCLIIIMYYEYE
jgi:hypothetical protein